VNITIGSLGGVYYSTTLPMVGGDGEPPPLRWHDGGPTVCVGFLRLRR